MSAFLPPELLTGFSRLYLDMTFNSTFPERDSGSRGKNGRRREGGEQATTNSVELGDLIYIKLRGGSWWPAQVVDENSISEKNKPNKRSTAEILVRIYGSYQYLYADPIKSCREFEEIFRQNDSSYSDILLQALEENVPSSKVSISSGSRSKTKAKFRKAYKESGKLEDVEANSSKAQKNARRFSDQNNMESTSEVKPTSKMGFRRNNSEQDERLISAKSLRPRQNLKQKIPSTKKEDKGKSHKQDEVEKEFLVGKKRKPSQNGDKPISGIESMENPSKPNRVHGNGLNDQRTETISLGKSPDSSTRRKRVMENLGLSPPPGSPFQMNREKAF